MELEDMKYQKLIELLNVYYQIMYRAFIILIRIKSN